MAREEKNNNRDTSMRKCCCRSTVGANHEFQIHANDTRMAHIDAFRGFYYIA